MKCKICGIRDDVCENCGKPKLRLTRHHISKGMTVGLCRKCHDIVDNNEKKFNRGSPEVRLALINELKRKLKEDEK